MHMLTEKMANEIVVETSLRLRLNINIMNTDGIIIAALDKTRIGFVHKGAIEVLKTGRTLVITSNENWEGAQPGVNLPIVFMDQIIGAIGVTGDPEKVESIGELVKMTTELMIKQEFMDSQTEWKQRTKEMIIDQLLKNNPAISSLEQNLSLLGIKFNPPYTSIIVQISERSVPNQKLIQKIEEKLGKKNGIIAFINVNRLFIALYGIDVKEIDQKVKDVYVLLKESNLTFRIAYSLAFDELDQFIKSYNDCEITLEISATETDFASFAQIEAKSLIFQVDKTVSDRFSHRILNKLDANQAKTLDSFFANDLNIQKTADDLYLHRNTLIYRLNKIIEETGYNPKRFKDAVILQVALWIYQKTQKK